MTLLGQITFCARPRLHAHPLATRVLPCETFALRPLMAKGNVSINVERCKGCAFCVEFCPTKVLALSSAFNSKGYHPPHVVAPEKCSGCDLCGMYCPDFAIYGWKPGAPAGQEEVSAG